MTDPAPRSASYEDLLQVPGNLVAEIISGRLITHPRPALPDIAWFELAPDWVCEVLSPSTACVDRVEKLPLYANAGVAHVWLLDPDIRILEVYENQNGKWLLLSAHENNECIRAAPFDAIEFELSVLWAD